MKKVLKVLLFILIGAFLYTLGNATFENARVNSLVKEFKSKGILVNTEQVNGITRNYYEVKSDILIDSDTYIIDNNTFYLGNVGDILASQQFPFPNIPIVNQFVTYYFGGHAAMISGVNEVLEIAGFPDEDEKITDYIKQNVIYDEEGKPNHDFKGAVVNETNNYFLERNFRDPSDKAYKYFGSYYRKKVVGLRVISEEMDRIEAVNKFRELQEKNVIYNYLFFLDTKEKYYCTDIMSRTYAMVLDDKELPKYNLNDDGFITSVNDLILSKQTIISNYFEVDKDGVEHIYYLVN